MLGLVLICVCVYVNLLYLHCGDCVHCDIVGTCLPYGDRTRCPIKQIPHSLGSWFKDWTRLDLGYDSGT